MPTIGQRHKDRIATLDSTLITTGIPNTCIPFGNPTNGSLQTSNNLTFTTGTNALVASGSVTTALINATNSSIGTLNVTGTATIGSNTNINGSLTVGGNERLVGTLSTGSIGVAATNAQGFVNVTALSAGPVGTWLTTGNNGVVDWNAIPNIAAGWTFDGTKIYSNAGIPVRVNSLSTGAEKFNVGGTSIFQNTLNVTNGGISVVGGSTFTNSLSVNGTFVSTGGISVSNGLGTAGMALFTNGSGGNYWSFTGGGFIRGSATVYPPGTYPDYSGLGIGPQNVYTFHPMMFGAGTSQISYDPDFVYDTSHGHGNSRMFINYSTRPPTGAEASVATINVVDCGGGTINCGISAGPGIRIVSTPPGYSGPPVGGGMALWQSNSSFHNSYAFIECENPDVDFHGGDNTQHQRFTVFSDGSIFSWGGNSSFGGSISVAGSVTITGTLTAGTKHFSIPHPVLESKNLYHSSIESSRPELIYRGKATLRGGMAKIDLDAANGMTSGTICALANMPDADAFVTNKTNFERVRGEVFLNELIITCESESDIEVAWMVVAERRMETMPADSFGPDGKFLVERDNAEDIKES